MKLLICSFFTLFSLLACSKTHLQATLTNFSKSFYFIDKPSNWNGSWAWYAPTFEGYGILTTPLENQVGWYFENLKAQGIAIVGVDVGESFGSPAGRETFEEFYQFLITQGFNSQGCMILQSRGGLMGYNWMLDHPGRVKCVAGIYPLTTVTDYIGVSQIAPIWGVTVDWLTANLNTQSPLERHNPLYGVSVYHLHGDSDVAVHLEYDQQFISQLSSGQLTVIPGQGHEPNSPDFFRNPDLLNFLINNLNDTSNLDQE